MQAPTHLQHEPIVVVNDYDQIDGIYAFQTDAQALSFGHAQYDKNELSLKVFRHTGDKWSRQSEELPVHRVFDLALLAIKSMLGNPWNGQTPGGFQEVIVQPDKINDITDYYNRNQAILRPQLIELRDLLNALL